MARSLEASSGSRQAKLWRAPCQSLLSKQAQGVLRHPAFKLADRDEPLATPSHEAQFRRHVGVEEVGTDPDGCRGLGRGKCDTGDRGGELLALSLILSSQNVDCIGVHRGRRVNALGLWHARGGAVAAAPSNHEPCNPANETQPARTPRKGRTESGREHSSQSRKTAVRPSSSSPHQQPTATTLTPHHLPR